MTMLVATKPNHVGGTVDKQWNALNALALVLRPIGLPKADGDCAVCGASSGHWPSCPFYK